MAGGRAQCNVTLYEPLPNSVLIPAKSANQTVYVQKISWAPVEFASGTVLAFVDSISGNQIGQLTNLPLAVGLSTEFVLDFTAPTSNAAGPQGVALTKGASLILNTLSGGVTGVLQILAYQLPLFVWQPYVAPSTAGTT